jgi:hypothetical protein
MTFAPRGARRLHAAILRACFLSGRRARILVFLRIMGPLTATPFVALPCRWRSRPQHQEQTFIVRLRKALAEIGPCTLVNREIA